MTIASTALLSRWPQSTMATSRSLRMIVRQPATPDRFTEA
jgi:hypothetical protein